MEIIEISNATRRLAESQDEYQTLPILDEQDESGQNFMTSLWKPSAKELAELNAGGAIRLSVMGSMHPPVLISTQSLD